MHWDSIQNFKLFANNVLALKTKDKPSEILFHRSPAGYEWASPKFKIYKFLAVKSNISDHQQSIVIYIMLWSLFTVFPTKSGHSDSPSSRVLIELIRWPCTVMMMFLVLLFALQNADHWRVWRWHGFRCTCIRSQTQSLPSSPSETT